MQFPQITSERKSASQGAKHKNCAGREAESLRTAFETAVLKEEDIMNNVK